MIFTRMNVLTLLVFMASTVLLASGYRREFNAVERRLDSQQHEIERLTDTLGKTVNTMAEMVKQEQVKH